MSRTPVNHLVDQQEWEEAWSHCCCGQKKTQIWDEPQPASSVPPREWRRMFTKFSLSHRLTRTKTHCTAMLQLIPGFPEAHISFRSPISSCVKLLWMWHTHRKSVTDFNLIPTRVRKRLQACIVTQTKGFQRQESWRRWRLHVSWDLSGQEKEKLWVSFQSKGI